MNARIEPFPNLPKLHGDIEFCSAHFDSKRLCVDIVVEFEGESTPYRVFFNNGVRTFAVTPEEENLFRAFNEEGSTIPWFGEVFDSKELQQFQAQSLHDVTYRHLLLITEGFWIDVMCFQGAEVDILKLE